MQNGNHKAWKNYEESKAYFLEMMISAEDKLLLYKLINL